MTVTRPHLESPEPETGSAASAPLTDAYRPIRRVAPPQAPVEGVLAAAGERRVVLADAGAVAGRVFLGHAEPPHHLLAPVDLVRRPDGHDVELPWCREPVARLLDARSAAARPLSGGELVTLVVSVLRGTWEAWQHVPPETEAPGGHWWIDDLGRPLFAPAEDGGPVAAEASALLAQAAAHTRDRVLLRLIEEAREALARPRRLRRTLEPLEDALFEACAPWAIERIEDGPAERRVHAEPQDAEPARAGASTALTGLIERFTDARFADTFGDAIDRTRTAARRALAGGRRLPMLVGGVAAAAVIIGGLLWPSDPEPADADDSDGPGRAVEAPAGSPPASTPTATPSPAATSAGPAEESQAAAERLRDAVAECAAHGDPLCATVRDAPVEPLADDVLEIAGARGEVALLDDYGDVAVFRLDDAAGGGQAVLVQIVRLDGRWLLRSAQVLDG